MKSILFPFNLEEDNLSAYATTMELAKQLNAKVIFFTSLKDSKEVTKDDAYLYLLGLHGYYQTEYNKWKEKIKITSERVIVNGDFDTTLKDFLTTTFVDWIMPTSALPDSLLPNVQTGSNATLVKYNRPHYPHLSESYCKS